MLILKIRIFRDLPSMQLSIKHKYDYILFCFLLSIFYVTLHGQVSAQSTFQRIAGLDKYEGVYSTLPISDGYLIAAATGARRAGRPWPWRGGDWSPAPEGHVEEDAEERVGEVQGWQVGQVAGLRRRCGWGGPVWGGPSWALMGASRIYTLRPMGITGYHHC